MKCKKCGKKIPNDSSFCPICGIKITKNKKGIISITILVIGIGVFAGYYFVSDKDGKAQDTVAVNGKTLDAKKTETSEKMFKEVDGKMEVQLPTKVTISSKPNDERLNINVLFTYDTKGLLSSMEELSDDNSYTTFYEYDDRYRLLKILDNSGSIQKQYQYDSEDNIFSITNSSGEVYSFNNMGKIASESDELGNELVKYDYKFDGKENIIRWTSESQDGTKQSNASYKDNCIEIVVDNGDNTLITKGNDLITSIQNKEIDYKVKYREDGKPIQIDDIIPYDEVSVFKYNSKDLVIDEEIYFDEISKENLKCSYKYAYDDENNLVNIEMTANVDRIINIDISYNTFYIDKKYWDNYLCYYYYYRGLAGVGITDQVLEGDEVNVNAINDEYFQQILLMKTGIPSGNDDILMIKDAIQGTIFKSDKLLK